MNAYLNKEKIHKELYVKSIKVDDPNKDLSSIFGKEINFIDISNTTPVYGEENFLKISSSMAIKFPLVGDYLMAIYTGATLASVLGYSNSFNSINKSSKIQLYKDKLKLSTLLSSSNYFTIYYWDGLIWD